MSTPQRGTASMVDDAAMADSLSRRDSLKMVVAALLVPLTSALPVEAGRVERDGHLAEALRLREATAAERLVATYGAGCRRNRPGRLLERDPEDRYLPR